jgi:hypothetical protein
MSYECHLTLDLQYAEKATALSQELHWKTSQIARDPVLGEATHLYLTTHSEEYSVIWNRMIQMVQGLKLAGVLVIREKIEHILWDTKRLQG